MAGCSHEVDRLADRWAELQRQLAAHVRNPRRALIVETPPRHAMSGILDSGHVRNSWR